MYTLQDYLDKVSQRYKAGISTEHIMLAGIAGHTLMAKPENFAAFTGLITDFAGYTGQTITSPSKLAKMMAGKAKLLAIVIEKALNSDFGKATRQTDPIIHFYETFLAEYDPKLRKSRGVWYTPEPVVDFIVRAVDDILKSDFNLPLGLADNSKTTIQIEMPVIKGSGKNRATRMEKVDKEVHKVQILDPATGTGTFLAATIKHIHRKFQGQQGLWSQYVEDHLIPRINGFEILMASYAMVHLKLDLLLKETGYQPEKQPRLNIYLTNSLEESHPDTGTLFASWLAKESNEANHIKRDTPVMVVMGNPPYSVSSSNKGEWIQNLLADYKKDLNEKNIQPLSDDYIKFIRYGQHYIEKNGEGILAYISNNSFIDGLIHRQMRKHLLETFDKIYILDLHGNNKKKETALDGSKDENVFDIMQGVSINIFIKTRRGDPLWSPFDNYKGQPQGIAPTQIYQLDCCGLRKVKYQTLLDNSLSSLPWNRIDCRAPEYAFVAKNFDVLEQYEQGFSVNDLFPVNSSGIKTHRDDFVIDMDKATLKSRIGYFYDPNYSDSEIASKLNLKDNRDWKISEARLKETFKLSEIENVLYRRFDYRRIYYSPNLIDFGREKVMQHFLIGENVGLLAGRQAITDNWSHIQVTNTLIDNRVHYSNKGISVAFPLYLYPENTNQKLLETPIRTPNLNPVILQKIAEKLGLTFIPEVGAIPCGRPLYWNEPGQSGQPQGIAPTIDESVQPQGIAPTAVENLGASLVGALAFAPIDLLDYIYAVLHSPYYRETYKEFLKIDFPRVPYPDRQTFWPLVKLGSELRRIHLLGGEGSIPSAALPTSLWVETPVLDSPITTYPNDGDNIVTRKINKNDFEIAGAVDKPGMSPDLPGNADVDLSAPITGTDNAGNSTSTGRVWINDQQYFTAYPS